MKKKLQNINIKKKLFNNLGLKLVSIAIAVVLWFVAVIINNPKESRSFANIRVTLLNQELLGENKVYEILDNSDLVRVMVDAPRDVINKIQSSDIVATADMSKLTEVNTIAIEYNVTTEGVEILGISGNHDMMRLAVEEKAHKWVDVKCAVTGAVAEGYMVAATTSDQTRIEVTGPKSAVDRISYVSVVADVANATADVSASVDTVLCDAEGNQLNFPRVEKVSSMRVAVQVLAKKEVPVEGHFAGVPAAGYLATGTVECNPSAIWVAGTVSALTNINRIILPAEELDITDATGNVSKEINIRRFLPEGVILADSSSNGRVVVTADVEPRADKTLIVSTGRVEVRNLPEGLAYEFLEDVCRVQIAGRQEDVSAVDQGAVQGYVDLAEWMSENNIQTLDEGSYNVPVRFDFSQKVSQEYEVTARVVISKLEEK